MANWKEIKRRIKSIKNTAKITKAMELISTVKMKKAQDLALEKKAYIRSMLEIFLSLTDSLNETKYFKHNNWWKTLNIVIASNKWLCWWYNVWVFKKVNSYVKLHSAEQIDYISIWKRATSFLARTWNNIVADFSADYTDILTFEFSKPISRFILEKFLTWEYSKINVFYTHYVNTIKQVVVQKEFLPLTKVWIEMYFKQVFWNDFFEDKDFLKSEVSKAKYTIEPSKEELLDELLPMILDSMFFDLLIEAKASEHSSRMIAMKNAKDNANKFASKLTLIYNKTRQASITTEITEIVSGVESMKD